MSAHSPAPWTREQQWAYDVDEKPFVFGSWIAGADGIEIAKNVINPNDANLMAAAPELYEEAKRLRKLLDDLKRACMQATERGAMMVHVGDLQQLANAPGLDAAILKAEGGH